MRGGCGVLVAGCGAILALAGAAAAQDGTGLPQAARAALIVRPEQMAAQPAVVHALGLNWVLRTFRSQVALGPAADRFTVVVVPVGAGHETVGLARGRQDVAKVFESLRDTAAGTIGTVPIFRVQHSPDYMALLGTQVIVEGSAPALRRVLETPKADAERSDLERALLGAAAPPSVATVLCLAGAEEASLGRMLRDLDCIWQGLARLVASYETPMKLLGDMRGGRADLWQDADSVRVRVLLVAGGSMEAKRSLVALRSARQLAPLASDAAVRAGSMTQQDADLVLQVLESMRTRAVDDKIYVDLAVDDAIVLPRR